MTERLSTKQAIRKAFDGAASSYDDAAAVQREICAHLSHLAGEHGLRQSDGLLLDVGCGTGFGLACLATHAPAATRVALDFAHAMLRRLPADAGCTAVCADLEATPLRDASIDGIWSSLALQWTTPARAFAELARILRPGGRAWLASLGPGTFRELREAFAQVDDERHVITFHAPPTWTAAAETAGLSVRAVQRRDFQAWSQSLRGLLHDVRAIGAHSLGAGQRKPLVRRQWRSLEAAYERHRHGNGLLPATYDAIFLVLEKPESQ